MRNSPISKSFYIFSRSSTIDLGVSPSGLRHSSLTAAFLTGSNPVTPGSEIKKERRKPMAKLSKEEFVKVINEIERQFKFRDALNEVYEDYDGTAPWDPSSVLIDKMVHLLNVMFDLEETATFESDIDYFIFELDFGRNPDDLYIEEKDGNKIYISSAEELYDWIIEHPKKENKK